MRAAAIEGVDGGARMRRFATVLLIAMAAIYLAARSTEHRHPAIGFVRAFAEAAMVGGLADWFAVTALFRHPLGLPIPHTAIIPTNKDRIGDELARFLRDNFLKPDVLEPWLARFDMARAAGGWLERQTGDGATALREGASRLVADVLESLDQERFGMMVRGGLAQRLRELDLAPLLGNALSAAIADNRHLPLMDGLIRWAARVVDANEAVIRAMIKERAGSILRWTGLDETVASKVIAGLNTMLAEMAEQPDHPLRAKAEEGLATLAHDLRHSPELQARVQAIKAELIENPALTDWWQGVWDKARTGLIRMARDPGALMAGQFGEAIRQLGLTLRTNAALAERVNGFGRATAIDIVAAYGHGIVRLVSDTVRGWDAGTITSRLERAVGRDLQFIRINGTVVGGLVGLTLHVVDIALGR